MSTSFGHACVETYTLAGTCPVPVEVQVDVGPGLPSFQIVGLGDTAVMEARERVRSAIRAQGYAFPGARVVVNLAPAPLRKHGTGFDLPVAIAVLVATRQLPASLLRDAVFVGELSLDGAVRSVYGMLAHGLRARDRARVLVAAATTSETLASIPGLDVRPVRFLADLRSPANEVTYPAALSPCSPPPPTPDLSEVTGQETAKRALEIAAAGGHNLLMVGPPGSGKTMLARRLSPLLPPLSDEECLETAIVYSVSGLDEANALAGVRPFRAPHHSCSVAGLVGGGVPPRPGEVSLAHNGVLFLDEISEFGPAALQSLRQPLEDGAVTLVRAEGRIRFPSRFALVAASNPCPCGYSGDPDKRCTCADGVITSYRARIGGPLIDRIDIHIRVDRIDPARIARGETGESSSAVRERVLAARERALTRSQRTVVVLSGAELVRVCNMTSRASSELEESARRHLLSGRGVTRLLRVSRTIADLEGADRVDAPHVLQALALRALADS